ncbi:hypothetical protein [Longispora albida]|uniref:hypothetical protein n=1 Tax=Longispora albida TaxID=203523 RepID=UPI0012FA1626|nr:hypothetical protein [Longispora albida]
MVEHVVIAGRPADVKSAALGWEQVLKQVGEVKATLEQDIDDLSSFWSGPAFEAYKKHMLGIAKRLGDLMEQAKKGAGIVGSLNEAAGKLSKAQHEMPVPAGMVGDLLAARNGSIKFGPSFCEIKLTGDFLTQSGVNPAVKFVGGMADTVSSMLTNVKAEAKAAYEKVNREYQDVKNRAPGEAESRTGRQADHSAVGPQGAGAGGYGGFSGAGAGLEADGGAGVGPLNGYSPWRGTGSEGGAKVTGPNNPEAWNKGWEHLGDHRVAPSGGLGPGSGVDPVERGSGLAGLSPGLPGLGSPGSPGGIGGSWPFTGGAGAPGGGGGPGFPAGGGLMVPGGGGLGRQVTGRQALRGFQGTAGQGRSGAPAMAVGGLGPAQGTGADEGEYSTWLKEDKSIWGGDDEEIAPAVLGKVEEPVSDWPEGMEVLRIVRRDVES